MSWTRSPVRWGLTAILEVFGLDVTRMHWDMTSISLHGAYPQAEEEFAVPKFRHPKDRRPDLKQIQAGLAVTGDGCIWCSTGPMTAGPGRSARSPGR